MTYCRWVSFCYALTFHPVMHAEVELTQIGNTEPSLYTVKAVLIMDNDGERLYAKYYDDTYPTVKEQKAFEKNIFNKTHRTDSEIALLEGLTVVYKSNIDLYFYVIGSSHENELMLMAVLNCLFDSLSQMLRKNVEKRALLENMEGLFLAVDEIVDGGVILESDPQQVVHRVALRGDDVPLTEQTVTQHTRADSSSLKSSSAACVNSCRDCDPSKRLGLNSKAAALHQGPRISPCSTLGLLMWKIALGRLHSCSSHHAAFLQTNRAFVETINKQKSAFVAHQVLIEGSGKAENVVALISFISVRLCPRKNNPISSSQFGT
ncbi:coatomer subunit zeta-1 [Silurus asotus]|uniref:Coatomer subunit zeta n=1 Tax=Silurus asotus TaxID=30991 RepID=A0AAD5FA09_SILAS|nr:coatomer subunit zeta-1 [Silurus asotus]